jgi:hypothetical protein
MGAPLPYARLRSTRSLAVALGFVLLPAIGCFVSLDGLTGGDGSRSDAGKAPSTSSGGGQSPGSIADASASRQGGEPQPPSSDDASLASADDDAASPSTGTGADDAAAEAGPATGTGPGSGSQVALVFGAPTAASPTIGGDTGTPFSETCPAGAALVGLNLVTDTASPFPLLQVEPLCAQVAVTSSGALSFAAPAPLALEGEEGDDESPGTLSCPSGTVVTGLSATAEKYVHAIVLECDLLVATASSETSFTIGLGASTVVGPFGNQSGGYATSTYECPAPLIANAFAGTAGGDGFLDSIIVGCATPSRP